MDTAEDVYRAHIGSEAAIHEQDDDVDDASDVRLLHYERPQRVGGVLVRIEHHRDSDAVFCHRLGLSEFQAGAEGAGAGNH